MTVQARAVATRQKIIDAAVDLFEEVGYGDTSLHDIIERAGVTKGAFYFHFPTKEALAGVIIEEGQARIQQAVLRPSTSSPILESLIRANLLAADMTRRDSVVHVGNLLRQALNQVSPVGRRTYSVWQTVIVGAVKGAMADGDLQDDIDVDAVAHTIWAAVLGTHLLSDATGDDLLAGLAQAWITILRGIVPPQKLPYFEEFVTRQAQQYTQPTQDASLLNPLSV